MMFTTLLKTIVHEGSLCLIDAAGRRHMIGDGSPPEATLRLTSKASEYRLALNPTLSVGEAYMDGRLVVEDGSIYDFLDVVVRNYGAAPDYPWLALFERLERGLKQANPIGRARRNVAHHYDLSSDFYDLFLDQGRQYSCAYFEREDDTLEAAQENKLRHISAKLLLDRPGLKVLDIGSGWGGLGLHLAENYGADVTGITLSREQHSYSMEQAARSTSDGRVRFQLKDYREIDGQFDRIVSVGMFEHVGKKNYPEFFAGIRDLLSDDGVALIHAIGYSDTPAPINPFIRKYIFPGADIPALSEVFSAVEPTRLRVTDVEVLRLHYAKTLRHWRQRFMSHSKEVVSLYDERFFRMWEFYLASCEVGFRHRTMMVFQMQLARRIDALPITRDYMFDAVAQPTR
ncbi:class I SAM-dependent methyltransferase [Amorphus sp. 3PC139-8]|uniref:class I SAM-dependent methyltransferase n=1 Tax=Amorphus sp. 3PC139-8 TaxID=2735676 RepID=UPI00345CCCCE